jgi:protein-disulfide isomerase
MMSPGVVKIVLVAVFMVLAAAPPSSAQSPDITKLQADITTLRKDLDTVQRELQEIKSLLRERRGTAAPGEPLNVVLSVGDSPFKGASDARVTLVEFTDYQCPFCARHHRETVPRLLDTYVKTGKVRYVVRDFPLESIHPAAVKAAEAPHCAAEGGKYWEMHERLFANPKAMSPDDLVAHAQALGLDAQAFKSCLESGKYATRVRQAQAEGARAGVRGTPSFFLGLTDPKSDKLTAVVAIRGAHPYASFEAAIEKLLAQPK